MGRLLSRLLALAAGVLLLSGPLATSAGASVGDEYIEATPDARGDTPSQQVDKGGGGGGNEQSAPAPAPTEAPSPVDDGSAVAADGNRAAKQRRKEARSVARASTPRSAELRRAILERRGVDEDAIEATLAGSASFAGETYLGGSGGIGLAFPLMLGVSALAAVALLWRRREP